MKLSDLKAYVAQIEAACLPEKPDPTVTFWLPRTPSLVVADLKESTLFIDTVIDESYPVEEHRIAHGNAAVGQGVGDFTIPLLQVPFYK